jgi:hypothetical protein
MWFSQRSWKYLKIIRGKVQRLLKEFLLYVYRNTISHFPIEQRTGQALKYLSQGRLTKCPMTLSLGRTYVRWPSDFDLRWTKLQSGRTQIHSGRTNNKPQFHLRQTECPVVFFLRRTISRMCRTMSVTDRYFKAWLDLVDVWRDNKL